MWYIYPQIIMALAIGTYLTYRFQRQSIKNWTTLALAIGFFSLALAGVAQFLVSSGSEPFNSKIVYFVGYVFWISGLMHILWAVLRLITKSIIFKYVLPIFIYAVGLFVAFWGTFIIEDILSATLIISCVFYVPLDLALGIFFLLLYSRLSFIKEGFRNNLGPFLIALGWFIHAITMSRLIFVFDKPEMWPYLLLNVIPYILWFVGFILLEKETERAFETKMKIRGLKKRVERK